VSELTSLTLAAACNGLKQKTFSAVELADAHLAAMEKARVLNAFVLETPERALAMAKACDARMAVGKAGPLEGIPLAVKDLFATANVRTTACSHILDNFVPTYESTVTSHLVPSSAASSFGGRGRLSALHRGVYCGPGRAFCRGSSPDRQRAPRTRVVMPGGRGPGAARVRGLRYPRPQAPRPIPLA